MPQVHPATEGYASLRGHRIHYRVIGQPSAHTALLCLHGGPGYGHEYLQPLGEMHATGRQVVFYDQLGCGASDLPGPAVAWSLGWFLEEIDAVRAAAGLGHCHLLGHGWGGMLALEYALTRPAGVRSLVLSSAVASVAEWRHEIVRLIEALPAELRRATLAAQAAADPSGFENRGVLDAFRRRHLCRMQPWPEILERSVAQAQAHPQARRAMLGPNELLPTGQLVDWNVVPRLAEIELPTLVLCGRHDLAPPPAAAMLYQGIPPSEWVVFEYSAHVPHLEEPQRYLEVLDGFLDKVEARSHRAN